MPRFALLERHLDALEMIEGVAKPHTALDEFSLGLVEQQGRELAVAAQDLDHVGLIRQLRVHLCPIVRRANEGKISDQEFERGVANRRTKSSASMGGVARRQEHDRQRVQQFSLAFAARLRQSTLEGHTPEALEDLHERRALGERRRNISITWSTVSNAAAASP